ncbi:MAG: hypothetical protein IIA82_11275 [Thaumarchaeota archaeon]|nr:hypothetical protein [Nitrososphaerota archaeon]
MNYLKSLKLKLDLILDNEIIVSIALWVAGFLMLGIGFSIIESWSLGGIVTILFGSVQLSQA